MIGASAAARPLSGITVLDLGRVIAGPLAALTLAELGATVIRVERPGGDSSWQVPPFLHPDGTVDDTWRSPADVCLSHAKRDHGKFSVELDYTTDEGRSRLLRLIEQADVLIENFRPGVLDAFGLPDELMRAGNPGLIHLSITGYGQAGPYRNRHGMALLIAAMSGATAKTGFPDGPPVTPGFPVADHASAVYGVVGILAALRQRDRTGEGQFVDVSMYDVMTRLMWDEPLDQYEDYGFPERNGNTDLRGSPYNVYRTADGWVALLVMNPAHFTRLSGLIGRSDLAVEYPDLAARVSGTAAIDAAVDEWTGGRTTEQVMSGLDSIDLPAAPVRVPWTTRHDPQTEHREMLVDLRHTSAPASPTGYHAARIPLVMSASELGASASTEPLGTSTARVLGELSDPD